MKSAKVTLDFPDKYLNGSRVMRQKGRKRFKVHLNSMVKPKHMKNVLTVILLGITLSCSTTKKQLRNQIPAYKPQSKELYDTIVRMDSTWEDAYNNCKLDVHELLISDNLEFYHDRGGVMTSKKLLIEALKNNICGKVTREVLKGNIEVYPINNYGAVEMGYHRFHNKNEKSATSHFARFVHIWHNENGQWKLTRVITLH